MSNVRVSDLYRQSPVVVATIACIGIFALSLFRVISRNTPMPDERPAQLWAARFTRDGNSLITAGGGGSPYETPRIGELVLWDLRICKERFVLRQDSSFRAVAVSPDGKFVASGDFDGRVKLLDSATGAIVGTLQSDAGINAVAFSPDGNSVVSGNLGGTITVWNLTEKKARSLVLANEIVLNIAISSDGNNLVATTRNGRAYLIDLLQLKIRTELQVYDGPIINEPNVEGVAFSPDGKFFATACQNRVRFWEYLTGRLVARFNAPANINSVAFSPDGGTLASVDSDGTLALWDAEKGECNIKANAHSGTSFCVTFSPDGNRIATIGRDDYSTKIWDTHTLARLAILTRFTVPTQ